MKLLEIENLSVNYSRGSEIIPALRGVSLSVEEGETVAVVGESGSGKSTMAHATLGLIFPEDGSISSSSIRFAGRDLLRNDREAWRSLRGKEISIIFQDPFSSLNPVLRIDEQLKEAVTTHRPDIGQGELSSLMDRVLREVQFEDPLRILHSYPHQLSGGQRQRIVIAMAIINRPRLVIADEPTTALDVTIQKDILDLLDRLKKEYSLTVLLITHNLPLAGERSDRIAVMYAGEIVEFAESSTVFAAPRHPYTKALIASVPRLDRTAGDCILAGQPPNPLSFPSGCAFHPRCDKATEKCRNSRPGEYRSGDAVVRCFRCKGTDDGEGK